MFVCDGCLRDSCNGSHLSSAFGSCEACGELKETWDCTCREPAGVEVLTLDQVRLRMLEHLRDMARQLHDEALSVAPLMAKVECAREMCRLAGIPETVIDEISRTNTLG